MVITSYRCHPFAVVCSDTITSVIGELLGRQVGMSNGKGDSMHMFTPHFFGGNGIVGARYVLYSSLHVRSHLTSIIQIWLSSAVIYSLPEGLALSGNASVMPARWRTMPAKRHAMLARGV